MTNKTISILVAVLSAVALVVAAACYQANSALSNLRTQLISSTLGSVTLLLKENQALVKELQSEPFAEKDTGILPSYLAKIRRDGVAPHADMKQRLDELAENNTTIVALLKAYSPLAKTPAFTAEADKFGNYSSAWRDRWNSAMELFMAGGNYPTAEVPFPSNFPESVRTEMAAAR